MTKWKAWKINKCFHCLDCLQNRDIFSKKDFNTIHCGYDGKPKLIYEGGKDIWKDVVSEDDFDIPKWCPKGLGVKDNENL